MKPTPKPSKALAAAATREAIPSPFAAARQHAERAFQLGQALGEEVTLCGLELIRLYELRGIQRGGDRKSGKIKAASCGFDSESWAELVMREVGISDDTARRWMQAARAQLPAIAGGLDFDTTGFDESEIIDVVAEVEPARLAEVVAQLCNGKTLEQLLLPLDAAGQFDPAKLIGKAKDAWDKICALCDPYDDNHYGPQFFTPEEYDAMHDDALVAKERIEAGELAPTRAWAGLRGRAAADGKGGRSATDHYKNLHTGLAKLRTSFKAWNELGGEDRAKVEAEWQELWKSMPDTWKATVKKLEGWK